MSALRLLRIALSAILIALASGAPHVVLAALDDDDCVTPCDCDVGGQHCPPNCTKTACAKSVFSTAAPLSVDATPVPDAAELASVGVAAPVLPLVTRGVFRPPQG